MVRHTAANLNPCCLDLTKRSRRSICAFNSSLGRQRRPIWKRSGLERESGRRRLRLEGAVELCPVIRHRTATTYISSYRTLCGKTVIHEQQQVYHVESHPSFSKSERKRVRISSPLLVLKRPVSSPTGNLYKQIYHYIGLRNDTSLIKQNQGVY